MAVPDGATPAGPAGAAGCRGAGLAPVGRRAGEPAFGASPGGGRSRSGRHGAFRPRPLEIACGTGNWTQVLGKRAGNVLTTDINELMLDIA